MQPRPARRQRVGSGGEARRDEAARKGTRTGKHAAAINRHRWPRLEGPRQCARYAAGGGGGGFGGLGGGGFGGARLQHGRVRQVEWVVLFPLSPTPPAPPLTPFTPETPGVGG